MHLAEFKKLLSEHAGKNLRFILPSGTKIPAQAHVTEVARIEKRFIDCGGTFRTELSCRLQAWFADDTDHRLTTDKLMAILQKSASFLESENLEVEVEYEAPFISHFPIAALQADDELLMVRLGTKHTACLAEDKCLPPSFVGKSFLLNPIPQVRQTNCCG
jgi:hypothetical protein